MDPVARDNFWRLLIAARQDQVTIFISTHFMNEAERCDRMSLMHAGRVLVSASPAEITRERGAATLEEAFIAYLIDAGAGARRTPAIEDAAAQPPPRLPPSLQPAAHAELCGAKRWSCGATRCAPRWRWPARCC